MKNKFLAALTAISLVLVGLFSQTVETFSQQIDPNTQVHWSTPITNTPGPLTKFFNNIPQADQFPGGDPSVQIRNAEIYALQNNLPIVDATHFAGVLPCTVDMFGALNPTIAAPINLVVKLPSAHFQCNIQQTMTNSAFTIEGQGPLQTQIEYTGSTLITAVMWAHAQSSGVTNGLTDDHISGIFFYGDNANATDALLVQDFNRGELHNVDGWGAVQSGVHSDGCVSTTFYRERESQIDATAIGAGVQAAHTWPQFGLMLDSSTASGNQTTAGTVIDNAAEFTVSAGWFLRSAATMTFTSGTAEEGLRGIFIAVGSKHNIFNAPDIEGNSQNAQGVDVTDEGEGNTYINLLAASGCSGCSSVFSSGGAVGFLISDIGLITGFAGNFNLWGNNQSVTASEGVFNIWTLEVAANESVTGTLSTAMLISSGPTVTFFPGTGITSVTCADPSSSGVSCTAMRGTIKVINSSASTTTSFAEIIFGSALSSTPSCGVEQMQGPTWLGLYVSAASTANFFIANANTLTGTGTFYIHYNCTL
jgi:hypothetical protein